MNNLICPDNFNGVRAFFTMRSLGSDISRISNILSIEEDDIFFPVQRHTDNILVIGSDLKPAIADAVVTDRKRLLLGVKVADCVPILLFDRKRAIIGAVHAGWRGTAAQIIRKTIRLMMEDFGSSPLDIAVALGPSIRKKCYHVDREVKEAVCYATGEGDYYTEDINGKYCIDLSTANILQVQSLGVPVENIWSSDECTFCNPEKYYSFRYRKDGNGRQGGFIGIL